MFDIVAVPGFSEPFSSLSHLAAALVFFVAAFYLCHKGRGNFIRLLSLLVFSVSLVFLFSMSGVYHLLDPAFLPRRVLQHLDHAGIWLLIAGTFTPIHIILFRGAWRWAILCIVWSIGITGLVLEMVFFDSIPEWMSLSFYLGLGWVGVLTSWQLYRQYQDKSHKYLWIGGLFYTVGAIIEGVSWPVLIPGVIGPHEIFHIFVILGAGSHWFLVYRWAHYPTKNTITFNVMILPDRSCIAKAEGELFRIEAVSKDVLKERIQKLLSSVFNRKFDSSHICLKYQHQEYI